MLGALSISLLHLAVGLDAMRQLAFSGSPSHTGTPSPKVEVLILVVMTVVFARWPASPCASWSGWRATRVTSRCGESDRRSKAGVRGAVAGSTRPERSRREALAGGLRTFLTAARLGWAVESN